MTEAVLDASALLAMVRGEPGADVVSGIILHSVISTVNASEAVAKLVEKGATPDTAKDIIFSLPMRMVPFDADQAAAAGKMWLRGKPAGLSFGDRACLALAESMNLCAITADRHWKAFAAKVEVRYIR